MPLMKHCTLFLSLLAGGCLLAACSPLNPSRPSSGASHLTDAAVSASAQPPSSPAPALPPPGAAAELAKLAARDFATTLKSRLVQQIQAEGLASAIAFCQREAPRIAVEIGQKHQVSVGRVPALDRVRNPANAATGWQAATVSGFQLRVEAGEPVSELVAMQSQDLPEGVALRFARGIPVEEGCLACHGTTVKPEVVVALARHYPEDRARGYLPGDLRGLLWVEVPQAALKH